MDTQIPSKLSVKRKLALYEFLCFLFPVYHSVQILTTMLVQFIEWAKSVTADIKESTDCKFVDFIEPASGLPVRSPLHDLPNEKSY